jgi:RimJ/RimL family protein N-acetyltransferase
VSKLELGVLYRICVENLKMKLLTGEREEIAQMQALLEAAPAYHQRVLGRFAGQAEAQSNFTILPPGKTYEDRFVIGFYRDSELIGCASLFRGYPNNKTAHLGLLLFSENHQRSGNGRVAYELIENFVREWKSVETIRLSVVLTNDTVIPFWKKQGFIETGERKPYQYDELHSEHILFAKQLVVPQT